MFVINLKDPYIFNLVNDVISNTDFIVSNDLMIVVYESEQI